LVTVLSSNSAVVDGDLLHYTLIDQKDLDLEAALGADFLPRTLRRGLSVLEQHDPDRFKLYASQLE